MSSDDENNYNEGSPRSDDGYQHRTEPSYEYQEPYGKGSNGTPLYVAYNERYAYQNPTGRNRYGIPTHN